jgi:hypothetical protein
VSKASSTMNRLFGMRGAGVKALLLVVIAMAAFLASAGSASAAYTHVYDEEFELPGCEQIFELNEDFTHDWLYAICGTNVQSGLVVKRYTTSGAPAPFSADAEEDYLEGNTITENPGTKEKRFGPNGFYLETAVDNSGGLNNGNFFFEGPAFLGNAITMVEFAPSGKLVATKTWSIFGPQGFAIDPHGNIYAYRGGMIRKFDPFLHEIAMICEAESGDYLKVDSHEGMWGAGLEVLYPKKDLSKYEPDAFSSRTGNIDNGGCLANKEELEELGVPFPAPRSPYVPHPLPTGPFSRFEVDPTNDDLLVAHEAGGGQEIWTFSRGTAEEPSHRNAPPFGAGKIHGSYYFYMAADDLGDVYITREPTFNGGGKGIVKFKRGPIVPDIRTPKVATADIGHHEATVRAHIELAGGGPITDCEVLWGKSTVEAEEEKHAPVPCSPDPSGSPFAADTDVSAEISGLTTNFPYHFYFKAYNENGWNQGGETVVIPVAVLDTKTEAATAVKQHEATLNGAFDPDNIATEYWFEYGINTEYGNSTPVIDAGATPGIHNVNALVDEIPAGRTFHYRIAARNNLGTTHGADMTFRTAATPEISGVRATEITATGATLRGKVDPVNEATTYKFVYGLTPAYGQEAPPGGEPLASTTEAQEVSQVISGLESGKTYHFALIATNAEGTTQSPDNTFDFEPPQCPNAHVRQQTHASYLPDCRGYELVSPGDAGSVLMFPTDAVYGVDLKGFNRRAGKVWPLNTGLANNPSRFAYYAGLGSIGDIPAPNFFIDQYVTTRTPTGWVTTLPGLKSDEALLTARTRCSDSLEVCIDHNDGEAIYSQPPFQLAANMFDIGGKRIGTLPTNVGTVPGAEWEAEEIRGDEQLSGDGNHYVFSSLSHAYAPGGITSTPGSVYDNDIAAKTVKLVSLTPSNEPIASELHDSEEYLELPGVSTDGSHILMSVGGAEGGMHLYMRVNDSVTYDVSQGAGVKFLGMTRNGSKVVFVSTDQLNGEDHDSSADLYQWSENGGTSSLKLLSQGNGEGDTDECLPLGFGGQCDAVELKTERGHLFGLVSVPQIDSTIASESGDVFFFSPENLDPERPGVLNQKNLYEYHDGAVHYVATFDPGTQVNRLQIAPDGVHSGFITASNLTGYDAHGKKEMYTYDVESGVVRCASCRPDGLPPIANATASQSGPFMSDDGRVFFNTKDPLVARDVDGELTDVYEYVNGRAQLISSGTASRDSTGGSNEVNILQLPKTARTGLESVSADGTDVYFTSYDTLVPQDENGSFIKFYDARTNGGFEPTPVFAGCEAADECHGEGAPTAPPLPIGTGAKTGSTGQVPKAKKQKRHHKRKGHRSKRHHKQKRAHRKQGAGRRG